MANLVRYASDHIQHMQKVLTQMNLHLHKVLSNVTGVTGMNIIRAIISGERDPEKLARIFYRMWTTGHSYTDLGSDYYENRYKEQVLRNISGRARELGYDAVLQPIEQRVA